MFLVMGDLPLYAIIITLYLYVTQPQYMYTCVSAVMIGGTIFTPCRHING